MGTLLIGDIELINFWIELEIENSYLKTTEDRIRCFNVIMYALKRKKMLLSRPQAHFPNLVTVRHSCFPACPVQGF